MRRMTRIALLIVVLGLVGCGKKKSPQSPAPDSTQMKEDVEERETNAPDNADDPAPKSSDPQEGGE